VSVRTYVHTSVTLGVAISVANDVIMRIAGLWRYGDWRHVATVCNALVMAALLRSRCGHYIFALWFLVLLSFFLFSRLMSAVADGLSTILPHMMWP